MQRGVELAIRPDRTRLENCMKTFYAQDTIVIYGAAT
jgi:hypothetical protein